MVTSEDDPARAGESVGVFVFVFEGRLAWACRGLRKALREPAKCAVVEYV